MCAFHKSSNTCGTKELTIGILEINRQDPMETWITLIHQGEADFHQIVSDMANIPRSQAKTINLGLFYGMGKAKLQAELGVSKEKAAELFEQYHAKVPFVKQLMNSASNRAQERGQIRTLLGRLCRFPLWEPNMFGMHKALPHEDALGRATSRRIAGRQRENARHYDHIDTA